jgi:hypothetical protein
VELAEEMKKITYDRIAEISNFVFLKALLLVFQNNDIFVFCGGYVHLTSLGLWTPTRARTHTHTHTHTTTMFLWPSGYTSCGSGSIKNINISTLKRPVCGILCM